MKLKERLGKFRITRLMIEDKPYKVQLIMAWMVIIRAESRFEMNAIDYTAYSPLFHLKHAMGCEPIMYQVEVTRSNQVIAHLGSCSFSDEVQPTHETSPVLKSDLEQEMEDFPHRDVLDKAGKITGYLDFPFLRLPVDYEPEKCSPLDPWGEKGIESVVPLEEMRKKVANAFAVPKHMIGKSGLPTFMESVSAEEAFPIVQDLGPNEWMQKDGSIIKICPKCFRGHTDRTVSHCEKCKKKFK